MRGERGHPVQTFVQRIAQVEQHGRLPQAVREGAKEPTVRVFTLNVGRHVAHRDTSVQRARYQSSNASRRWNNTAVSQQAVIRERTLAGLKAARARGCKGGRKFALSKAQVRLAQAAMAHRDTSVQRARYQASNDALQIRRAEGGSCASRARRASPPDRSAATSAPAEHVLDLSVGFRPLPQTTR